ncbi:MAG: hypothetical protein B6I26_04875 [Desulfobacteraceae bacterium 4572_130]|nr:MAG: hypothetical protein B6I26_04875 [Desulfobacteraceae bacterium 4572_130]
MKLFITAIFAFVIFVTPLHANEFTIVAPQDGQIVYANPTNGEYTIPISFSAISYVDSLRPILINWSVGSQGNSYDGLKGKAYMREHFTTQFVFKSSLGSLLETEVVVTIFRGNISESVSVQVVYP